MEKKLVYRDHSRLKQSFLPSNNGMIGVLMTDPAQPPAPSTSQSPPVLVGTGAGGKEVESGPTPSGEVPALTEIGHEVGEIAPEVSGAGVKVQPTTVQLPQNISQMGVKAVGQATPPPAVTVTLPLSDDQIAQGLHASITSSWRWLSEWCLRRLKQVHLGLKAIHGKITRVKQ